jgi:hypothetical protein
MHDVRLVGLRFSTMVKTVVPSLLRQCLSMQVLSRLFNKSSRMASAGPISPTLEVNGYEVATVAAG